MQLSEAKKLTFAVLPSHTNYGKYSFLEMVLWLQHRGISSTSLPLQPERRYTWFYNLIEHPELMFEDYTKEEMMEFVENTYPDDFDCIASYLDNKSLKEEFTKYIH